MGRSKAAVSEEAAAARAAAEADKAAAKAAKAAAKAAAAAAKELKAAAQAAAAKAAAAARLRATAVAEQLQDGRLKPQGVQLRLHCSSPRWCAQAQTSMAAVSLLCRDYLEAACAHDLMQIALLGTIVAPHKLNFPAGVYQQQQVEAFMQLLLQRQPSLQLASKPKVGAVAAVNAAEVAADRAARAAVAQAVAVALAAATEAAHALNSSSSSDTKPRGVTHTPTCKSGPWRLAIKPPAASSATPRYFGTRLEACCAADLARLALYGPLAFYLNLPAATYTQQQIAAWQQLLYPDGAPAAAAEQSIEHAADAAVVAAAEAAAAASPAGAALFSGDQQPPHSSWVSLSNGKWTMQLQMGTLEGQKKFTMCVRNGVQAACAADLARLAIQGLTPAAAAALNFPASVYTQQQVAAMAALLQLKRPGMQLAGLDPCSRSSTSSSSLTDGQSTGTLLRSAERVKQRAVLQAAADAAVAEAAAAAAAIQTAQACSSSSSSSSTKLNGVKHKPNSKFGPWRMSIILPHAGKQLTRYFSTQLEACCAADLARLALHGPLALYLNLPAATYTQQQIAAWQQLLYPAGTPATAAEQSIEHAADAAVVAAAEAAAAAAPAEAALFSGEQPPPRGSWVSFAKGSWSMSLQGSLMQGEKKFTVPLRNGVQAACAADLARLSIHGLTPAAAAALNFPSSVYTLQQVADMAALLQLKRPGLRLAGTEACSSSSSSSSSSNNSSGGSTQHEGLPTGSLLRSAERVKQRAALRAAADAAVAEAAAAAAATEAAARFDDSAGDGPPYGSCVEWWQNKYWRLVIGRSGGKLFARSYSSRLHAACAADLAQLALGGIAVNVVLGSLYRQEQVAAMRQLLLFERPGWSAAAATQICKSSDVAAEAAQARSAALAQLKLAVLDAAAAVVQVAPEQAAAILQARRLHGCSKEGSSWRVLVYVQVMGCAAKKVHVFRSRDAAAAACASDLARLAVHRRSKPELNFPEHVYSSEQVAAFGALLAACYPRLRLADAAMCSSSSSSSSSSSGSIDSGRSCADSSDAAGSSKVRDRINQADAAGDVKLDQQQQQQQRGASSGYVVAATAVLPAADTLCAAQQQRTLNSSTTSSTLLQRQQLAEQQRQRLLQHDAEQLWPSPIRQVHQVAVPQLVGRSRSSRGWRTSRRLGAGGVSSQYKAKAAAGAAVCRTGTARCWW
jgi:hypothetical protein